MRVIVKRLSMETTQNTITFKRRSFFLRLVSGIAGGGIAENLFSRFVHTTRSTKSNETVQVIMNPLAIPRATKNGTSHGE
jgi:hypothetical protein